MEIQTQELELVKRIAALQKEQLLENSKSYNELLQKSVNNDLSPLQHTELLKLTSKIEAKSVERLKYLHQLSVLWNASIDDVMDRLQIKPPPVIHA